MKRHSLRTPRRNILGIDVLVATRNRAIEVMDDCFESGPSIFVTFLNANVSNLATRSVALTEVLERSLVLNDGIGVHIASRALYGEGFPENLQGTDFIPQFLCETRHTFRIYALGALPGVAARAMAALSEIAPQHSYVGAHDGYFAPSFVPELRAQITASGANLVLVAMGSPEQELWADKFLIQGGGPSAIGVGGLFDFLSKERPRAPLWIRQIRCEWIYRLMNEPRRLARRYLLGNPVFMARLLLACFRSRPAPTDQSAISQTPPPGQIAPPPQ